MPSWVNLDLAKILHGLAPEFLKALRQTVREFAISDEQRRESAFLDERMVQGEDHGLVIHDVKGMAKLSGVPNAHLNWRPHEKSMLGQLALHVATLPRQLTEFVTARLRSGGRRSTDGQQSS